MARSVPWLRLFAEGSAIVVSILLAFGIQAWWEGRQQRQEELRTLGSLLDEVRVNSESLDATIAYFTEVQVSTDILLEVIADGGTLPTDSVSQLLSDLTWWHRTDFQTGALDAVLLGGNVSVVSDEGLRRQLADWKRAMEEFLRIENQDFIYHQDVWTPFLRENAYFPSILARVGNYPGRALEYEINTPPRAANVGIDHSRLLRDPAFHNVLAQKWTVHDNVLGFTEQVSARLEELTVTIDGHLTR